MAKPLISPVLVLPNGRRIPYGQIVGYDMGVTTGGKITIERTASSNVDFTPNDSASVLDQLDKVPELASGVVFITDVATSWTSITLSAWNIGDGPYAGNIAGVGIGSIASLELRFDDGAGHVLPLDLSATGPNSIDVTDSNPADFPVTGTYTLYYQTPDVTWATTGLAVVVS